MMTHCRLARPNVGVEVYHCWLPNKYAVVGTCVDIDGVGDGWTVVAVYNELPTAVVVERSQDYKRTRRASDI